MNFTAQRILDQRQASLRPPLGWAARRGVVGVGQPDFAHRRRLSMPPCAVACRTTTRISTALQSFAMPFTALPARPSD